MTLCNVCLIKKALYGEPGAYSPVCCSSCAPDTMVDLIHKKCDKCGLKCPIFNTAGETIALYCKDCADDSMVDVKHKLCQKCNLKRPNYNTEGETSALYCKACADVTMVNVLRKKCEKCNCSKHKQAGMIRKPRTKCIHPKCKQPATHGTTMPKRCEVHLSANDVNLILRKCNQCSRLEACNKEQICYEYCFVTDIFHRRRKVWERRMITVLEKQIKTKFYSLDMPLDTACNLKRPDVVYDCKSYFLIIECDEKQHKYYGDKCETNRLIMIAKAAGLPILVIRYNPDCYLDGAGKLSRISDRVRERELIRVVKQGLDRPTCDLSEYIRVIYLFYDKYDITVNLPAYMNVPLPIGFFECKISDSPRRKRKFAEISIEQLQTQNDFDFSNSLLIV